ncbi:hypothetical protein [Hansschlegelia sp. KR7-227]|uniref:hypothetical protein n=1 Tax=Hansschlegelia sp. KR7-227 TaxID=3400914 RepID=UPI003C04B2A0
MTPKEYREAKAEFGLSLAGASKFFQTDERTTPDGRPTTAARWSRVPSPSRSA